MHLSVLPVMRVISNLRVNISVVKVVLSNRIRIVLVADVIRSMMMSFDAREIF
jgi:hypothetical protein